LVTKSISTSTKSTSNSEPSRHERRKPTPVLARALKRKPSSRPLVEDDLKWLWAAYRKGSFTDMPEGMTTAEFRVALYPVLGAADAAFVLVAGEMPVGVVLARIDEHRLEPHAYWFSWATRRQKLEAALAFFSEWRKTFLIVVTAREESWPFFRHLVRYGVLRPLGGNGIAFGWYGKNRPALVLQTREP
jgi:hypothetical protein